MSVKAGRELDALVAEKVMGLRLGRFGHGDALEVINEAGDFVSIAPYSTDIAASWEVVEAMRAKFPSARFALLETYNEAQGPGRKFGAGWSHYLGMGDVRTLGKATADTAPLAIALAALKAVGATEVGNERV